MVGPGYELAGVVEKEVWGGVLDMIYKYDRFVVFEFMELRDEVTRFVTIPQSDGRDPRDKINVLVINPDSPTANGYEWAPRYDFAGMGGAE